MSPGDELVEGDRARAEPRTARQVSMTRDKRDKRDKRFETLH
jgi:hypothetical protein